MLPNRKQCSVQFVFQRNFYVRRCRVKTKFQDKHAFANADLKGLIPRSFYYLFYLMHKNPNAGYRLTASYLEIYNEQVSVLSRHVTGN